MSGRGFLYFYRTYTATASGSITRRERCVGCSRIFEYKITRSVAGGGHSAFMLNNAGAAAIARRRARANLNRALDEAIEPVHCPTCGIYQPAMVGALRERHGIQFDPNKYASERIAGRVSAAWDAACAANTIAAYSKFMEVWPTFDWHAKTRIKGLSYRRKLVGRLGWMFWGALAFCAIGLMLAGIIFSR
jgi:hypothetical protein